MSRQNRFVLGFVPSLMLASLFAGVLAASDWPAWRGSLQNGVSDETNLISSWSPEGENLIWRRDFIGRSTPVVLGGRVFVIGRSGSGPERRELVAAFDAESGDELWRRNVPVYLTTVPFNRTGWASLVADPETEYVYAQGIAGPLICFDRDGNVVWQRELHQELGRFSGYGGRTLTPTVDEDLLIVGIINSSWGELGAPRHRYFGFDKRSGDVVWISTPGGNVYDRNTSGNGVVGVVGGRRLYFTGNGDGHIYALEARTGRMVWKFELSKRGINASPVLIGDTLIIGHSEENIDEAVLGRLVAIDATGEGDVTKSHERWRRRIKMGFGTPLAHQGRVYVMDNSANLHALDASTGETQWEYNVGTVGKQAPVWADGKIYVTETNGRFHIIQPGEDAATELDFDELSMPDGSRYAETYGSPAVAYGRIYFTTEEGLYCLGDPQRAYEVTGSTRQQLPPEEKGTETIATLQVVPGDVTVGLGERIQFEVRAYNEKGRPLGTVDAEFSLNGLEGEINRLGRLQLSVRAPHQAGHVLARAGELEARARVRVFGTLPMSEDFDDIDGRGRPYWIGAGRYQVTELEGEKVLEKPLAPQGLLRSNLYLGPHHFKNYTVTADLMGSQKGRRRTDAGLVNGGYVLDLLGIKQQLEIRTWSAEMRMAKTIDFPWEMGVWYTMKLRVDAGPDQATIRGKVWKRGEEEPEEWTITANDPIPSASGAPGVQGYSPASIYFDNVQIAPNS